VRGVLLRSRDGRRFLVAQLMDSMAGGLSLVVLPWMVLDAGGSRSLAGAAFLIATIPYLVLGLHAGELGDRRQRKPIMVWAAAVQAVAASALPLIVALGPAARDLPVALIFAAGMGVTAGRVFVDAAAFGATARLVGDAHFVEGQANLSLVWSLGFLIGPALGGGLIGLVGAVEALWVEAAGFALAAVLLASIRTELGPETEEGARRAGVLAGVEVVARDRALRRLASVSMAWNLTVGDLYFASSDGTNSLGPRPKTGAFVWMRTFPRLF
jgi:MFS family permease